MNNLLELIDIMRENMQKTNTMISINLPQIIVIGEQSSGKTSVLEAIVGKEFLPKGTGIVTRRPVIIQLVHTKSNKEYAEFAHIRNKKYDNFDGVKNEIQTNTNHILGNSNTISKEPIFVKIVSPNVVNLTLIDLPGLTKIPINNQPDNISEKVFQLVCDYLSNPNSIILAIIPAISDVVNSDALKIINKFDPSYERTIGVVTKIDLMDSSTNCLEILQNKIIHTHFGWVGVINRSFSDLKDNVTLSQFISKENSFFHNNIVYKNIANQCGIQYLRTMLQDVLKIHIQKHTPAIKENLQTQLEECMKSIQQLQITIRSGNKIDETNYIVQSSKDFTLRLKETLGTSHSSLALDEISLGVIIQKILNKSFLEEFQQYQNNNEIQKEIQFGVENAGGIPGYVEIPDVVIRSIVKSMVKKMIPCVIHTIQKVENKIIECICFCMDSNCPYTNLNYCIQNLAINFVSDASIKATRMMQFFIECEVNHINFRHPDFTKCPQIHATIIRTGSCDTIPEGVLRCPVEIDDKNFKKSKNVNIMLNNHLLSIYNDDITQSLIGSIDLKGCKIKNIEKSLGLVAFSIYHSSNKYVFNSMKLLHLKFASEELMVMWKEKILDTILSQSNKMDASETENIELSIKVEKMKVLIDKYIKIVVKNVQDLMVKFCHLFIISGLENYLQNELSLILISSHRASDLLYVDDDTKSALHGYKLKLHDIKLFLGLIECKFSASSMTSN